MEKQEPTVVVKHSLPLFKHCNKGVRINFLPLLSLCHYMIINQLAYQSQVQLIFPKINLNTIEG